MGRFRGKANTVVPRMGANTPTLWKTSYSTHYILNVATEEGAKWHRYTKHTVLLLIHKTIHTHYQYSIKVYTIHAIDVGKLIQISLHAIEKDMRPI